MHSFLKKMKSEYQLWDGSGENDPLRTVGDDVRPHNPVWLGIKR